MVYTLTLNPSVDYYVSIPDGIRPGMLNRSREDAVCFGGKGINVSRVLRELGIENAALGFVAGFTGKALEEALRADGMDTRFVHTQGLTRITVKVKGGDETEINGCGTEVSREEVERLYEMLDGLETGDVLILSGSLPRGMASDSYGKILQRLAGRGIEAVVDASGDALGSTLAYRPFMVKPNQQELGAFFGKELSDSGQVEACARELQRLGARNVLVSMAGEGAVLVDETGQCRHFPAPAGQPISSIGAGDSMVAGFLAGWLRTGCYTEALKLGIAAGSATAFSMGLARADMIRRVRESMDSGNG